jgi:hypothetical protein
MDSTLEVIASWQKISILKLSSFSTEYTESGRSDMTPAAAEAGCF